MNTETAWFSAGIQKPSQFRLPRQKSSKWSSTTKTIHSRSTHKNQVNFDPHIKTKLIRPAHKTTSVLTTARKTGPFRCPHQTQANFDPALKKQVNCDIIIEIKPISIPSTISSRFQCSDAQTELISIQKLKTSHFPPPRNNRVNSDLYTEMKTISTPHTTTKLNSSPLWNQDKFHPPHWNEVDFDHPHKNQVKFDSHNKTIWFPARRQNPSQFRPPTQKPSRSIPTLKTSHFRPANQNQFNVDP